MSSILHTGIPYPSGRLVFLDKRGGVATWSRGSRKVSVLKSNVITRRPGHIYYAKRLNGKIVIVTKVTKGNNWGQKKPRSAYRPRRVRSASGRLVKSSKSRVKKPRSTKRRRTKKPASSRRRTAAPRRHRKTGARKTTRRPRRRTRH